MIDLTKELPNVIKVGGRGFTIYTDYRTWLRFSMEFEQWQSDPYKPLDIQYLFRGDIPIFECMADYNGVLDFAFPRNPLPNDMGDSGEKLLYLEYDMDLIYAAFMQQYHIDLCDIEMHWWKFKALLSGLTSGTKLSEVMSYRAYSDETVDMKREYRKLKSMWTPQAELTEGEEAAEDMFDNMFG